MYKKMVKMGVIHNTQKGVARIKYMILLLLFYKSSLNNTTALNHRETRYHVFPSSLVAHAGLMFVTVYPRVQINVPILYP